MKRTTFAVAGALAAVVGCTQQVGDGESVGTGSSALGCTTCDAEGDNAGIGFGVGAGGNSPTPPPPADGDDVDEVTIRGGPRIGLHPGLPIDGPGKDAPKDDKGPGGTGGGGGDHKPPIDLICPPSRVASGQCTEKEQESNRKKLFDECLAATFSRDSLKAFCGALWGLGYKEHARRCYQGAEQAAKPVERENLCKGLFLK